MFIVWPNGRALLPVPYPGGPSSCLKRSPDKIWVCGREKGHEQSSTHPTIHIAYAPQGPGKIEHMAEWLDLDAGKTVPEEHLDRNDIPMNFSPVQAAPSIPNLIPKPVPPDPPALISRDRQTSVFYGEIYELDLIPDATDEDYRTLPTLEQLNKMRGR